jgi:hypothetical protein
MNLLPNGLNITEFENECLSYLQDDTEEWLQDLVKANCDFSLKILIEEWLPRLYSDETVTKLPATEEGLRTMILGRADYKSRQQIELELEASDSTFVSHKDDNMLRWLERTVGPNPITLFPRGLQIDDEGAACILSRRDNIEDFVVGALLGRISKGKKLIVREYQPKMLEDPDVVEMPANEEELITMILARSDYQRLGG